jgi:CrcB protein
VPQPALTASHLVFVAAGSAIGGAARFALTLAAQPDTVAFPVGTLLVNALGCLMLGGLLQLLGARPSYQLQLLLATGFCGGFTTFSTFSYESIRLMQTGLWNRAAGYIVISLVLGLLAVWAGMAMARAALGAPSPT